MKTIFSKHAKNQMFERNISEDDVISTLLKPDKIISQPDKKFKAIKLIKKRDKKYLIVVIFRQINSIQKVITAFLTTKIKKYLK